MKRAILFGASLSLLGACGGGSSTSTPSVTPPITVIPTPSPTPAQPAEGVSPPTVPPNFAITSCDGLDFINLLSAQETGASLSGFGPENAIDDNLDSASRWETTETSAEITIDLGFRHLVREIGTAWFQGDQRSTTFNLSASEDGVTFAPLLTTDRQSGGITTNFERTDVDDTVARFVRITGSGNSVNASTSLIEASVFGCPLDRSVAVVESQSTSPAQFNLDPAAPPGDNFDMLTWSLDTPEEDSRDGFALRTSERSLDDGFVDPDHFFTGPNGGVVFRSTIFGVATSRNTRFNRSELREMLRRGDTSISTSGTTRNNWVLGYQPDTGTTVGGRNGILRATLKIDHVTTTGTQQHQGRVIIGQIHASNDEPLRLYYKKFPDNDRGYLYFAHELNVDRDDLWYVVVGPENDNVDDEPIFTGNPETGIELGEIFSYEINQQGPRIDVTIRRGDQNGPIIGHNFVNMIDDNSGYDLADEWNYFRAGAYTQNDSGESGDENGVGSDFDEITFFDISNTHGPQ